MRLPVLLENFHRLFVGDPGFCFADPPPPTLQDEWQIAVLPEDEFSATRGNAKQVGHRAEIPIRNPQVARLDRVEQFGQQRSFLSMTIFARQHDFTHDVGDRRKHQFACVLLLSVFMKYRAAVPTTHSRSWLAS